MNLDSYADAAIATLKANLAAELVALGSALPAPRVQDAPDGDYYYGGQESISTYPAIEVAAPDAEIFNFSIGQVAGDAQPVVYVVVWDQDANFRQLGHDLGVYAHAIRRVLLRPDAFGPHIPVLRISVRRRHADPEARDFVGLTGGVFQQFVLEDRI